MGYSDDQRERALELYNEVQSVSKVIQQLGYPSKQGLYPWIGARNYIQRTKASRTKYNNTPDHPLHPPLAKKLEILRRCFELGENMQLVSEETGYSRVSIYMWRKKYIQKGAAALMNLADDPRGKLPEGKPASSNEVESLKSQLQEMQMEIDILKETIEVLKKDPGVDLTELKNREKAVIIGAIKGKYPLPLLLSRLQLARSSYFDQLKIVRNPKENKVLTGRIIALFQKNSGRWIFRRYRAT